MNAPNINAKTQQLYAAWISCYERIARLKAAERLAHGDERFEIGDDMNAAWAALADIEHHIIESQAHDAATVAIKLKIAAAHRREEVGASHDEDMGAEWVMICSAIRDLMAIGLSAPAVDLVESAAA